MITLVLNLSCLPLFQEGQLPSSQLYCWTDIDVASRYRYLHMT